MSSLRKKILLAGLLMVMVIFSAGYSYSQSSEGLSEEDIGLRNKSLYDEQEVQPAKGIYPTLTPGESKRFSRAFENSPPLIPHDLTGMLPISETNNMCKGCHMPEIAKGIGAIPVPKTHLMDMDTGRDLGGKLDGARFNCMQCHVPQVKLPTPVKNIFEGDFRSEKGKYSSDLADTLNEGVTAE
jgi:cytochrome c-type protein NapB